MHKRLFMALGVTGILCFTHACTQVQTFPYTEGSAIDTTEEFEKLATDVQDFKGESIKLAGQVRRVEENDEGLLVIADWLPYPKDDLHFTEDWQSAKTSSKKVRGHRFTFLYPGAKNVDPSITWKGNKFIILGDITGKKDIPTSLTGQSTFPSGRAGGPG